MTHWSAEEWATVLGAAAAVITTIATAAVKILAALAALHHDMNRNMAEAQVTRKASLAQDQKRSTGEG